MCSLHNDIEAIGWAVSTLSSYMGTALNSNFSIAATGSFFGAVGGYVLVLITNRRAEILSKIDRTKVAIALTHSLFNVAYGLNKQHLYSFYKEYIDSKKKFEEFIEEKNGNVINNSTDVVRIPFNCATISMPYIDFEFLNSHLLRETGFSGRAFILATELISSLHTLERNFKCRHETLNEIIEIFTKNNFNNTDKAFLYYGIEITRETDNFSYTKYLDVMKCIKNSVESCIWFSKELTLELIENAEKEAKKIYIKRPKIGSVDYSDVDSKYMPNDEYFKDYREKFKKA